MRNRRIRAWAASVASAGLLAALVGVTGSATADPPASRPNVVMIVTDDQTLEEMRGLPLTKWWLGAQGTTFNRAYISYPLCCPARASMLTGQYMHNNGVRGNGGAWGGWYRFNLSAEARALPTWLRNAGYYNVHIGKYMNGYTGSPAPVPPGWDEWYGKYSEFNRHVPGAKLYYNYRMLEDPPVAGGVPCPSGGPDVPGEPHTCFYGQSSRDYQTDVISDKAVEAIHRLGGDGSTERPFFLNVSFNAPHSPYVPAARHAGLYAGMKLPKLPGANEKNVSDKPRFLRRLPKLGKGKRRQNIRRRRARLAMLASVDQAVHAIAVALHRENELNNTYLMFVSDNGYFQGQHRIRQGKYLPHEPSARVPLMIRGPGIPRGAASEELVSNVDIAETVRHIAGASASLVQDGRSLLPFARLPSASTTRPLLLEGDAGPGIDDETGEGPVLEAADRKRLKRYRKKLKRQKRKLRRKCKQLKRKAPKRALLCFKRGVRNLEQEPTLSTYNLRAPAYRALRTDRYLLTLYSNGVVELYDMRRDPHQLRSVHKNRRYKKVRKWMLARLNEVALCRGPSCSRPIGREPKLLKSKKGKKGKKAKSRRR